jgi:hypothetical protein
MDNPSFEEILDIHFHSGEVNAVLRDRGINIETEPVTYGRVNGHEAAYQNHILELDMPDMDENIYAKSVVVGWTCEDGISYTAYLLHWGTGEVPDIPYQDVRGIIHEFLDSLECH